jgi:predicted nucleic acid-binding protein
MIVVSDTSCISNLLLIGQIDLLQKIYSKIFIPLTVYNEILMLEKSGRDLSYFKSRNWVIIEKNFTRKISLLPPKNIDAGEAEAIDLAIYIKADRILIDERKGSVLAKKLGITTIGLLGILIIAKKNHLIVSVKDLLYQLIENNFWLSNELYNTVLKSANEQ